MAVRGNDPDEERAGEDFYFPSHVHLSSSGQGEPAADAAIMNEAEILGSRRQDPHHQATRPRE